MLDDRRRGRVMPRVTRHQEFGTEGVVGTEWLTRRTCTRVYEHYPHNFSFEFGPGVLVDCLWRIVAGGRLVRTSQDHGQKYGLPAPLDAYAEAESLLRGRRVLSVRVRAETDDLIAELDGEVLLEVLSDSGYEPYPFAPRGFIWWPLQAV
ncbi:MAG: hypothetical protein U0797_28840 [Gemmataceae bacterium]